MSRRGGLGVWRGYVCSGVGMCVCVCVYMCVGG